MSAISSYKSMSQIRLACLWVRGTADPPDSVSEDAGDQSKISLTKREHTKSRCFEANMSAVFIIIRLFHVYCSIKALAQRSSTNPSLCHANSSYASKLPNLIIPLNSPFCLWLHFSSVCHVCITWPAQLHLCLGSCIHRDKLATSISKFTQVPYFLCSCLFIFLFLASACFDLTCIPFARQVKDYYI